MRTSHIAGWGEKTGPIRFVRACRNVTKSETCSPNSSQTTEGLIEGKTILRTKSPINQ